MPTYKVRDPETGRTVTLRGDGPPTGAELEEVFANLGGESQSERSGASSGAGFAGLAAGLSAKAAPLVPAVVPAARQDDFARQLAEQVNREAGRVVIPVNGQVNRVDCRPGDQRGHTTHPRNPHPLVSPTPRFATSQPTSPGAFGKSRVWRWTIATK